MLYDPVAIFRSLPTLFFDTGRPSDKTGPFRFPPPTSLR
jgi:hypothetical protein